jgi:hypothetical protein
MTSVISRAQLSQKYLIISKPMQAQNSGTKSNANAKQRRARCHTSECHKPRRMTDFLPPPVVVGKHK